jgi:hypothetical protein
MEQNSSEGNKQQTSLRVPILRDEAICKKNSEIASSFQPDGWQVTPRNDNKLIHNKTKGVTQCSSNSYSFFQQF